MFLCKGCSFATINLTITHRSRMDFNTAYNLDFTGCIELDYKKLQYVPWSKYDIFMAQYFPNLRFEYDLVDLRKKGVSGLGLNCYLRDITAGISSSPMYFPVMDNKKGSDENIDSRSLNDNIQRAYAKCIARTTGFTLRLWTREGIDINAKNDSAHPVFKGLVAINNICNAQNMTSYANFSWSIDQLRKEYKKLAKSLETTSVEKTSEQTTLSLGE